MTAGQLNDEETIQTTQADEAEPNLLGWLIWLAVAATAVWVVSGCVAFYYADYQSDRAGQIADAMGSANGLFSALTVFLVALSIHFQTNELRAQREQLRLQRVDLAMQRDELVLTRAEQAKTADALQQQVDVARKSAYIAALGSVTSTVLEAAQDIGTVKRRYLWLRTNTDRTPRTLHAEAEKAEGFEDIAAAYVLLLERLTAELQPVSLEVVSTESSHAAGSS